MIKIYRIELAYVILEAGKSEDLLDPGELMV